MNQIERITHMEQLLEQATQAVKTLAESLDEYEAVQEALRKLETYYGSEEWKKDFAADEQGLLPNNLKRGVLSEDGIWNVLEENRSIKERIKNIS